MESHNTCYAATEKALHTPVREFMTLLPKTLQKKLSGIRAATFAQFLDMQQHDVSDSVSSEDIELMWEKAGLPLAMRPWPLKAWSCSPLEMLTISAHPELLEANIDVKALSPLNQKMLRKEKISNAVDLARFPIDTLYSAYSMDGSAAEKEAALDELREKVLKPYGLALDRNGMKLGQIIASFPLTEKTGEQPKEQQPKISMTLMTHIPSAEVNDFIFDAPHIYNGEILPPGKIISGPKGVLHPIADFLKTEWKRFSPKEAADPSYGNTISLLPSTPSAPTMGALYISNPAFATLESAYGGPDKMRNTLEHFVTAYKTLKETVSR